MRGAVQTDQGSIVANMSRKRSTADIGLGYLETVERGNLE